MSRGSAHGQMRGEKGEQLLQLLRTTRLLSQRLRHCRHARGHRLVRVLQLWRDGARPHTCTDRIRLPLQRLEQRLRAHDAMWAIQHYVLLSDAFTYNTCTCTCFTRSHLIPNP